MYGQGRGQTHWQRSTSDWLAPKKASLAERRSALNSSQLWGALESLGGWPILGSGQSGLGLSALLGSSRRDFAHEVFFSLYVYADAKDTEHNVLYVCSSRFSACQICNPQLGLSDRPRVAGAGPRESGLLPQRHPLREPGANL